MFLRKQKLTVAASNEAIKMQIRLIFHLFLEDTVNMLASACLLHELKTDVVKI
jgi:hypothetical protein